jgi:hypothetical protein
MLLGMRTPQLGGETPVPGGSIVWDAGDYLVWDTGDNLYWGA